MANPKKGKSIVNRHVSGPQLLEGFRQHVLETYGPMSYPLLHNWGLRKSVDVGNVVFNIIETGLFRTLRRRRPRGLQGRVRLQGRLPASLRTEVQLIRR
jgi:uncharacterized repeat protein (TIGR04138 family)